MKLSKWVIYHSNRQGAAVLVRRQSYFYADGPVISSYRTQEAATAAFARIGRTESRRRRQSAQQTPSRPAESEGAKA